MSPKARIHFKAKGRLSFQKWLPELLRLLKKQGFGEVSISESSLELPFKGSPLSTAVTVASLASFAYGGDATFKRTGRNEFVVELVPL